MPIKKFTGLAFAGLLLLAVGGASLVGQGGGTAQEKQGKEVKTVPMTYSDPNSGVQMYKDYCAACHGMEGQGNGPAVEFLKAPPRDLRTLAQRNNGNAAIKVRETLLFGTSSHAHGTIDMPLWGPMFRAENEHLAEIRIYKLTQFVESLQQK